MIAARRTEHHWGLQHAAAHAVQLGRPLLVLEALGCTHRWANARSHRFLIDGMADNAGEAAKHGVSYYPYVEPSPGAARGLVQALAERACLVVTDDFPSFHLPTLVARAAELSPVRTEAVDSNGLLPIRASDRVFASARGFRSWSRAVLIEALDRRPDAAPMAALAGMPPAAVPDNVAQQWPRAPVADLAGGSLLGLLDIDHTIEPVDERGGSRAARAALTRFLEQRLDCYSNERNEPDLHASSGMSPWLHFGHVSSYEIFDGVAARRAWSPEIVQPEMVGNRVGWWGLDADAESFLDQLITWRELNYHFAALRPDHDDYGSLPDWARHTLELHAGDARPYLYDLDALASGATHDAIWNAAQNELRTTGRMHNYMRMLWGKKILEWTPSPAIALEAMIELNNRYALDGRDPNSYGGIFWCLGRFDRAWGPERPVFGKVRYMTSRNTARKLRLKKYVERYTPSPA